MYQQAALSLTAACVSQKQVPLFGLTCSSTRSLYLLTFGSMAMYSCLACDGMPAAGYFGVYYIYHYYSLCILECVSASQLKDLLKSGSEIGIHGTKASTSFDSARSRVSRKSPRLTLLSFYGLYYM